MYLLLDLLLVAIRWFRLDFRGIRQIYRNNIPCRTRDLKIGDIIRIDDLDGEFVVLSEPVINWYYGRWSVGMLTVDEFSALTDEELRQIQSTEPHLPPRNP